MAASLSRPDPSSPASVAEAGFSTTRRGYHQDEVRAFLVSVASELGRLQERQRQLEAELHSARSAPPSTLELDDETLANALGEETLRVLHTARESASEIKIRAEENAARVVREATEEANRIRQETEVEAARKRYDAAADAEAEVTLAKQQGREMVNEARSYRERVLADLERRTTLARHQIEELLHGRDRLLQVFERARLVAVDVTSDLDAIDSPDHLVNLAPTTGPVPLMVPSQRAAREGAALEPGSAATAAEPNAKSANGRALVGGDGDGDGDEHRGTAAADTTGDSDLAAGDADEGESPTELLDIVDAATTSSDETDAADEAVVDTAPAPERDANVVSLFRGRVAPHPADTTADTPADGDEATEEAAADGASAGDEAGATEPDVVGSAGGAVLESSGTDATNTDERPDVGGIFARLRSEVPTSALEAPTPTPTDSGTGAKSSDDNGEIEAIAADGADEGDELDR